MGVLYVLILFTSLTLEMKAQHEQCYADTKSPNVHFGYRTSYFACHGFEMSTPQGCEPIYIWSLIRHGTGYPGIDFIKSIEKLHKIRDEIIQNHKNGRGNLCEKDLQNLAKWSFNLTVTPVKDYDLAPQGKIDQIFLARRIKEAFPELMKSSTKDNFTFGNSGQNRTKKSSIVFINELIGTHFNTSFGGNDIKEDAPFLEPTRHCPKLSEVENNPTTESETNLFKKTAYFRKVINEISLRLGYVMPLSYETIKQMHDICAYENAWNPGSRPSFCAAFLPNETEAFNYVYDLLKYYQRGYGNPLVRQMACPIVRDLITSLTRADQNVARTEKGKFLFSHSETIFIVTATMGLSKDFEQPKHDNYQKMINRKWKSSIFDPFSANIVAVLYRCSSKNSTQTKVVIYQNEHPAVFSECNNSSLCNLETLQKLYSEVSKGDQCDMTFCQLSNSQIASSGCSKFFNLWNSSRTIFAMIFLMVFSTFLLKPGPD